MESLNQITRPKANKTYATQVNRVSILLFSVTIIRVDFHLNQQIIATKAVKLPRDVI